MKRSIRINKFNQFEKLALFCALFLVSGAAGLIYEIIWERLLELYFGVSRTSIRWTLRTVSANLCRY
jgi:hypothetical protein